MAKSFRVSGLRSAQILAALGACVPNRQIVESSDDLTGDFAGPREHPASEHFALH